MNIRLNFFVSRIIKINNTNVLRKPILKLNARVNRYEERKIEREREKRGDKFYIGYLHWCCKWSISSSPQCNISLCWRAADCRIPAPRTSTRHRTFCCNCSSGPIFPSLRGRQQAGHPCPRIACVCTTENRRSLLFFSPLFFFFSS